MPTGGGGGSGNVQTNSTLTGNGSGASPLSVNGWPLTYFSAWTNAGGQALGAGNQVMISGFVLPYALTFGHISVVVNTADAVNNYDIGIYNQAGTLVADVGAQTLPSTGRISFTTVQGSKTIAAGLYVLAFTGTAITAKLSLDNTFYKWIFNSNVASSVGGALPATVGALTVSESINGLLVGLF